VVGGEDVDIYNLIIILSRVSGRVNVGRCSTDVTPAPTWEWWRCKKKKEKRKKRKGDRFI
jgi:hypothetical protein